MKTRLVRVGNSRGVRIPKPLIEEAGLDDEVEITVRNDSLVIRAVREARAGWSAAFAEMAERGDDALVHGDRIDSSRWDEDEWEW